MAFSRMAKAKPKAAPGGPASDDKGAEVESSTQDDARKRAIEEAKRKAVEEDSRWKENYSGFGAAYQQNKPEMQQQAPKSEEQVRQERIERSKAEAAKRAQAQGGFGAAPGGGGFGSGSKSGFSWKKQTPEPSAGGYGGASATKGAGKGGYGGPKLPSYDSVGVGAGLPSHDDCEQAISAMISRTVQGMKEGLLQLGLPDYPLHFIPGKELKLCGHDCREVINEMIHSWMTEEKEEFYKVLKRIKQIVANPIITEEEMEFMAPEDKEKARATASAATAVVDDDDDDEVVDLPPKGTDRPAAPKTFEPPAAPKPAPAPAAPKPEVEDYYALLGVDPKATLQEIRLKFRQLVVTEHPEKGGDPKKFAKLNKAYSVLSDTEKRKTFDGQRTEALEAKLVD